MSITFTQDGNTVVLTGADASGLDFSLHVRVAVPLDAHPGPAEIGFDQPSTPAALTITR